MGESLQEKQETKIPKIIHQIWIGEREPPLIWINTWISKNPDFQHILWTEAEIERRGFIFKAQEKIDLCNEICGKVDIMRLEILYEFGGIFIDADSICIEPINGLFITESESGFATFENENFRKGLIANGNLATIPKYILFRDMLDWILSADSTNQINTLRAWACIGPVLLTQFLNTGNYPDFRVLPSYTFLPIHFCGSEYKGHRKVYAHQLWGSNYGLYDKPFSINIPKILLEPDYYIPVIVHIRENKEQDNNEMEQYIRSMIEFLKAQTGYFGIYCVFIRWDLDDTPKQKQQENRENKIKHEIQENSRFIKIDFLSNTEIEKSNILLQRHISIPVNCILYPDSLENIKLGKSISVNLYEFDYSGEIKEGKKRKLNTTVNLQWSSFHSSFY